jgi:lipopolysaccharide export system permease protein
MILTFFIVMFILLMHFLWMQIDNILGKGLPMSMIFELLFYASATFVPLALPLATLLASIMTLGNMGEYNELLALKSAGVSLVRIVKPLVVIMVFISAMSFFFINNVTPMAWIKMRTMLHDFRTTKHEMRLQPGIFYNGFDNMSIRVDSHDPDTHAITNVLIYQSQNLEAMRTIVADSGSLQFSEDRKYVILELIKGQIYEQNRNHAWYDEAKLNHVMFDYQKAMLQTSGFSLGTQNSDMFKNQGEALPLSELDFMIDSLKHQRDSVQAKFGDAVIKNYVFRRLHRYQSIDSIPPLAAFNVLNTLDTMSVKSRNTIFEEAKRTAANARNYMKSEIEDIRVPSTLMYRMEENWHKKFSLPFAIMIFFLIGAPLGAIIRKGGLGMPIVVSVSFFVFYYMISITGENLVKDGILPAYIGSWISSAILLPIAVFLTYKSTNDSALFNPDAYKAGIRRVVQIFYKGKFKGVKDKK